MIKLLSFIYFSLSFTTQFTISFHSHTDVRPTPPNWYRFDTFIKEHDKDDFQIPDKIRNKPGKLIYFSLGSMGSLNVGVMKKIIAILAQLPYRFIISKGNW